MVLDADETVDLTLFPGFGDSIGTSSAVIGMITNHDLSLITLGVSPATAAEAGTSIRFYLHRIQKPPPVELHPRQSGDPCLPAMALSREQILAASSGWVAVLLNVLPGLGTGYLYQRRWKAYWITAALASAWFVAGAFFGRDADPATEMQNQLIGLIGLLVLAAVTAVEAGLAVKRVRQQS
jgi:hypothetical protein